jgi:bacillithiol system protein YtxJ
MSQICLICVLKERENTDDAESVLSTTNPIFFLEINQLILTLKDCSRKINISYMGFLSQLNAAQQAGFHPSWKHFNQIEQTSELIATSYEKPVIIFKHSIRCGTSAMIKHQLETNWNFSTEELDVYYLDLINYRPISNKVAEIFGVVHQSPQIIVIKNGEVTFNTSHLMINTNVIRKAIS